MSCTRMLLSGCRGLAVARKSLLSSRTFSLSCSCNADKKEEKIGVQWVPAQSKLSAGQRGLRRQDVREDTIPVSSKPMARSERSVTPLITPIYTASTYNVEGVEDYLDIIGKGGYIYQRMSNPTTEAAEVAISDIEKGAGSLCFSSGMAAVTTAFTFFLNSGDHIIAPNPVYSSTHKYLAKYLAPKYGVEVDWVRPGCPIEEYRKLIKPNTKMLYAESPCNPLISVTDLEGLAALGKETGIVTMVDTTYASPYLIQPCDMGIDIAMHSATKYMGGHCDLMAGCLTFRDEEHWKLLNTYRMTLGNNLSPFDSMLLLRGIKSLAVRMDRHSSSALTVAQYLEKHPKVKKVYYPGLPSHEGHEIAKQQMKSFSGTMAFEMEGGLDAGRAFIENVRLIQLAVSLGGAESLVEHPASMTHGPMIMTAEERREALIADGLIRLSIGLENPADLVDDCEYALSKA